MPWVLSMNKRRIHRDLLSIHEKYGPVVRIAPDELSFVNAQAIQDIYARRNGRYPFPKNPAMYNKAPNGAHYLLTALDSEHPRLRQQVIRAFSNKAKSEQEILVQAQVDLLLQKLDSLLHDNDPVMVDIGQEMSYAVFDILGELGFKESFNCINSPNYRDFLGLLFTWPKAGVLVTSLKSYKFFIPFLYFLLPRDIV